MSTDSEKEIGIVLPTRVGAMVRIQRDLCSSKSNLEAIGQIIRYHGQDEVIVWWKGQEAPDSESYSISNELELI